MAGTPAEAACLAWDSAAYQRTSLYGDDVVIVAHIGLHFASPNVATSRILFLMITLQVQMWHRHQTKRVKDIFCPHVWRSTMGFCSESVRFEGGGRNIRLGLNRTGKSCRLRWVNYLHPGLKRGKMTNR
ncbi:uncharacterized protein LOC106452897 isoform X1 [Brassica napus]|uniref:uncharacterized protein LOC106452897 isoform X1 n=2 Tax=Brassica napus TaxID=3708 RepID=UPI0006AACA57|nr:uncharacterized protein LOC106452897 isoform X1 [Brassica napus]